jgi:transposase-like protein
MVYEAFLTDRFFSEVTTEAAAISLLWKLKFAGAEFRCSGCGGCEYYQMNRRIDVRQCRSCRKQCRVRAGTIFENSKTPVLKWLRAIYFVTQGKRGVSALELMRHLGMSSYGTVWAMLHKIREALRQRDEEYKLKGQLELDGATFGRRESGTTQEVLVAVETKDWVDAKGKPKSKAGFAKVVVAKETKENAQAFMDQAVEPGSMVNTDGSPSLRTLKGVDVDYQIVSGRKEIVNSWLPWVHKLISNSKAWVVGTHHGVGPEYLNSYLAEYFYRFNRRHDPKRLFHRAVRACVLAKPVTYAALFG